MSTWREQAWSEILTFEERLTPVAGRGVEVRRRKTIWAEIDGHEWHHIKDGQFGQLELLTRTERDLLAYLLASPPMRDLLAAAAAPDAEPLELPPEPQFFPDWRARALFQVFTLEELLGGPDDSEAKRRSAMWVAIDRYDWPHAKEQQFAKLELATRTETELLKAMFTADAVAQETILAAELEDEDEGEGEEQDIEWEEDAGAAAAAAPAPARSAPPPARAAAGALPPSARIAAALSKLPPAAHPASPKTAPAAKAPAAATAAAAPAKPPEPPPPPPPKVVAPPEDALDPMAEIAPVVHYKGPSASQLYKEGQAAWSEYAANEFKKKAAAREAARRLREVFLLLDRNPDAESQLRALEMVVGLKWQDVMDNVLEKRLR